MLPRALGDWQKSRAATAPTAMSFAQFEASAPQAGWFKIADAQLEVGEALWVEDQFGDKAIGNIYIPARRKGTELGLEKPITVLVRVPDEDAAMREFVTKLREVEQGSDAAVEKFALANLDKMQVARTLQGTVAGGVDVLGNSDASLLKKADAKLADNFVILQEGVVPSTAGRVILLGFSILLCAGGLLALFQKPKKKTPPAPSGPDAAPNPHWPQGP